MLITAAYHTDLLGHQDYPASYQKLPPLERNKHPKHNTMTPLWMDILSFVLYFDLRHVFVSAGLTFSRIRLHLHQIWCRGRSTGFFIHFQWGLSGVPNRAQPAAAEKVNFFLRSCHSATANHLFQLTRTQTQQTGNLMSHNGSRHVNEMRFMRLHNLGAFHQAFLQVINENWLNFLEVGRTTHRTI